MTVRNTWWRRGGIPLGLGSATLLALGVAGFASGPDGTSQNRQDFAFEPSRSGVLRALLTPGMRTEHVCVALVGSIDGDCAPSIEWRFASPMPPVVRTGTPYRYAPRIAGRALEWRLEGHPPSLQIDPNSGIISGTPRETGRFEVTLSAMIAADTVVQQRVALFVDDRALWLGADRFGDDILQNAIRASARVFFPALLTVVVGVVGGTLMGAFAGFYGGPVRRLLSISVSALQSLPGLLLVFIAASASDLNRWVMTAVLGIILAPDIALGVKERVEALRSREFVDAAREIGMRDRSILWNEIVWCNARDFLAQRIANGFVFAIMMEVTLSYVGLAEESAGGLGSMLRSGRATLVGGGSSAEAVAALLAISTLVTAFLLLSRGVRKTWARAQ